MKQITTVAKNLVENTFAKQKILVHLGTQLRRVEHGEVELWLPKTELALQHHGFIHGGILSTIADVAAGLSGFSVLTNPEHSILTVELKINFMRPADTDITCVGRLLKENRSLLVTTAEVLNSDGKLCAYMLQTLKRITPEDMKKKE